MTTERDVLVALSLLAATVHAWLAPGHVAQAWWLGAAFAVSAALQTAWAIAVLQGPPPRWGLQMNLLFVAVWVVSRTVGLPGLAVEPVGVLDLLTVGAELSLCALLVLGRRAQTVGVVVAASLLCVLASGMGAH